MQKEKIIEDPIYDNFEVNDTVKNIIQNELFQRLKKIKQNGNCYKIFSEMKHTRYEHSLGVYYLTKRTLEKMYSNKNISGDETFKITKREIFLISVAGLLHDIGHCFYSHLFDYYVAPKLDLEEHEERGLYLVDKILLSSKDFTINEINFVKGCIIGIPYNNDKRKYLYSFVHNKEGKIDTDKIDYLMRDEYYYKKSKNINHQYNPIYDDISDIYEYYYVENNKLVFKNNKHSIRYIKNIIEKRYFNHKYIYQNEKIIMINYIFNECIQKFIKKIGKDDWSKYTDEYIDNIINKSKNKKIIKNIEDIKTVCKISKMKKRNIEIKFDKNIFICHKDKSQKKNQKNKFDVKKYKTIKNHNKFCGINDIDKLPLEKGKKLNLQTLFDFDINKKEELLIFRR